MKTVSCLQKGHFSFCPCHSDVSKVPGKQCVSYGTIEAVEASKARKERIKAQEAEKKAADAAKDIMNQTGKDRKPRSDKDESSGTGAVQWRERAEFGGIYSRERSK